MMGSWMCYIMNYGVLEGYMQLFGMSLGARRNWEWGSGQSMGLIVGIHFLNVLDHGFGMVFGMGRGFSLYGRVSEKGLYC